jgi:hypothetical protein
MKSKSFNNLAESPTGWYLGSYLLRFVELRRKGNHDPARKFLTWENTRLIKADNFDEAYAKLLKFAKEETEPYKGGPAPGVDVQWVFEGVTDLLPIHEQLEDGAEILWTNHGRKKLGKIRSWAITKRKLFRSGIVRWDEK